MIMTLILRQKFQNGIYGQRLFSTGGAFLVEHSSNMRWGDGLNGTGENLLGRILMNIRHEMGGVGVPVPEHQYSQTLIEIAARVDRMFH